MVHWWRKGRELGPKGPSVGQIIKEQKNHERHRRKTENRQRQNLKVICSPWEKLDCRIGKAEEDNRDRRPSAYEYTIIIVIEVENR